MRLWVEIPPLSLIRNGMTSASLWGCELKYRYTISPECVIPRQPPCEAVSWNVSKEEYDEDVQVSASLWGCELKYDQPDNIAGALESASLWGCELKWPADIIYAGTLCVSLLVRLWVEMERAPFFSGASFVSLLVRLWVEMPWIIQSMRSPISQPPCEAVSWNITRWTTYGEFKVSLLVRLWVEIIPFTGILWMGNSQPPCEAVSWNENF